MHLFRFFFFPLFSQHQASSIFFFLPPRTRVADPEFQIGSLLLTCKFWAPIGWRENGTDLRAKRRTTADPAAAEA
jgi:hypothetical protein